MHSFPAFFYLCRTIKDDDCGGESGKFTPPMSNPCRMTCLLGQERFNNKIVE